MYQVTLITEGESGIQTKTLARNVGKCSDAMELARKAAGKGARYVNRGAYAFAYVGPNGCVDVIR
jgi:hypothetical protein